MLLQRTVGPYREEVFYIVPYLRFARPSSTRDSLRAYLMINNYMQTKNGYRRQAVLKPIYGMKLTFQHSASEFSVLFLATVDVDRYYDIMTELFEENKLSQMAKKFTKMRRKADNNEHYFRSWKGLKEEMDLMLQKQMNDAQHHLNSIDTQGISESAKTPYKQILDPAERAAMIGKVEQELYFRQKNFDIGRRLHKLQTEAKRIGNLYREEQNAMLHDTYKHPSPADLAAIQELPFIRSRAETAIRLLRFLT